MKRLLAIIVVIILALGVAAGASGIDWQSMTDEEIMLAIDEAQAEIKQRAGSANNSGGIIVTDGAVLLDYEGLTFTVDGEPWLQDYGDSQYIYFNAVLVNNGSQDYIVSFDDVTVNGWQEVGFGGGEIAAGKKSRSECSFYATDAKLKSLQDIEECLVKVMVMDNDYDILYECEETKYIFN